MIRHSVSALRWRDLLAAAFAPADAASRLRDALAVALGTRTQSLWLTGAGRSALHAFVRATRRGDTDEALLPGYTCVVVPNVFRHLGLSVRYVDIAAGGLGPTVDDMAGAIGPNTRWLVCPHNFGVPTEGLEALRARFPDLLIIEDAAHAFGSRHADGTVVGTRGHAAFFSFEYSKCLTTGMGGALVVNEPAWVPAVAAVLDPAGQHPMPASAQAKVLFTVAVHLALATWPAWCVAGLVALMRWPARALGVIARTQPGELSGEAQPDYGQALPPRLAALALPQLARMPQVLALRQQQARHLGEALVGSPWLYPLAAASGPVPPGTVLLRFPLAVAWPQQREALCDALRSLGIEPGAWFDDVVHPSGSVRHGYTEGDCPNGERLARCIVNLPLGLHARLSQRQWRALRRLAQQPPEAA